MNKCEQVTCVEVLKDKSGNTDYQMESRYDKR